jgi:phosphoribosylformylglycinamidine synthase subunit PurQ / glutaminase
MKTAVITFPASNCDRDTREALHSLTGIKPISLWHTETSLPAGLDLIVLPGGFSYGDYLRCGAMAASAPIIRSVKDFITRGGRVIGICNGFQILCEAGLLPGVLLRNKSLKFICKDVYLQVSAKLPLAHPIVRLTIAHAEGNYFADTATLAQLEAQQRIAFRYCDASGNAVDTSNPNGAAHNIAGIFNEQGNVLGMMPHPERSQPGTTSAVLKALLTGLYQKQ